MVSVEEKAVLFKEYSNPVSAATEMLAVKFEPVTAIDWEAEAEPSQVVNAVNDPVVEMVAAAVALTVSWINLK
jgi:hypothetical protein